ncbi:MAG: hypothetical protein AABW80_01335 [Nanoarchaeota archaeon]
MSEQDLVSEMKRFEEDSKWLRDNENILRIKGLSGKFVAVKNKQIIASNKDVNILVKYVEEKGENPACLVIEFVYPEGTVILL